MAFEYYGGMPLQGLDYSPLTEKQQQQQSPVSQIDPNQFQQMIQNIMGSSGNTASMAGNAGQGGASQLAPVGMAGGGTGAASLAGSAGGGGTSTLSPVASGSGGGMSGAGALFSNPWSWLAAAIVGNELYANHRGYRRDGMDYWKDLFSGEVLNQDFSERFLPDIGIDKGSKTNKWISTLVNPISADLGRSWARIKELF